MPDLDLGCIQFKLVKQQGCEAYHSPPSSAEIKNVWSYTSSLSVHLHGMLRN
jgi:hypothetical protein